MEVDSLLQLRDSLIAKASLNKMELEDCQDILNNIETDVSTRGFFGYEMGLRLAGDNPIALYEPVTIAQLYLLLFF